MSCMYCEKSEDLKKIMIEIIKLDVSTVYLYKEQSYIGRCVLVVNKHVKKLIDVKEDDYIDFFKEMRVVANAINGIFKPDKINYLILGDESPHLHVHLVPKYKSADSWGSMFEINPEKSVFLSDNEYTKYTNEFKAVLKSLKK